MKFWGKNKGLPPYKHKITDHYQAGLDHGRKSKEDMFLMNIENALKEGLNFRLWRYKDEALRIASKLPSEGKTKGDLMAIAYRQILGNITMPIQFADQLGWDDFYIKKWWYSLPYAIEKEIDNRCRSEFLRQIEAIEAKEREKRQQLTLQNRDVNEKIMVLSELYEELEAREKEIDQQREDIRKQTETLKAALVAQTEKPTVTPHMRDMDKLEKMLEELRRLKNGG